MPTAILIDLRRGRRGRLVVPGGLSGQRREDLVGGGIGSHDGPPGRRRRRWPGGWRSRRPPEDLRRGLVKSVWHAHAGHCLGDLLHLADPAPALGDRSEERRVGLI